MKKNWSGRALHSQVMVITGASSGIGLCTLLLAAERGCKLVAIARSDATLCDIVHGIRQRGGKAIAFAADVADWMRMQHAAEYAVAQFGRIDTWVNCAGVPVVGRVEDIVIADKYRLFDTNFWGVVNGTLAAIPHLRVQGGAIVNVGCDLSALDIAGQGMYAVSKHAMKAFTRAFREDLRSNGESSITVSLIEPVAVDTPFMQHARNYLKSEHDAPSHPIHPALVAEAILAAAVQGGDEIRVDAVPMVVRLGGKKQLLPRQLETEFGEHGYAEESAPALSPLGALYRPCQSGRVRARKPRRGGDP